METSGEKGEAGGRGGVVWEVSGSVTLQSLFNVFFNQLLFCVTKIAMCFLADILIDH